MNNAIELLSPAGDMEKLNMALVYGADAVYLAGREFGMRASSANFSDENLKEAIRLAHQYGSKVYITCNTLPREDEYLRLPEYLEFLEQLRPDGLIIADLGILESAVKYAPSVSRHVSTQLGVVNSGTAAFLYEHGADTVVLARELSLEEIRLIRENTPRELRLEAFVHGAMCVSFSGRCLLSNYLTGRDSNRGQCAQPCRWKYHLMEETRPGEYFEISEDHGTFIMNSKDMRMIEHIPELIEAGVSSLKIEGRMKSAYYTAVVTNAYRHAVDQAVHNEPLDELWVKETEMVSHRPYCTGFYYGDPGQHYGSSSYSQEADIVAVVERSADTEKPVLSQRNKFSEGEHLELLLPGGKPIAFTAANLKNENGEQITDTPHAKMYFTMDLPCDAPLYSIIRRTKQ